MGILLSLFFVLAEDLNWSMLRAGTKKHTILSFSSVRASAGLNKHGKERAICNGLEHTNFHARTQHPCRIKLRRDFTLPRAHTLTLIQYSFLMPTFTETTKQATSLKRKIEERLRNYCYRGRACYIL
jgi:hypothetical protein